MGYIGVGGRCIILRYRCLLSLLLLALAVGTHAAVTVVGTFPANGARGVDPSTTELKVRFSEAVRTDSYSFVNTDNGTPIKFTGGPVFSEKNTVCTVSMQLEPNTRYAVSINAERFHGFRSASDSNTVVTPYLVVFTTGSGSARRETTPLPSESTPVIVLRTYPENGGQNVDPKTDVIRVRFSRPVSSKDYAFVESEQGEKIVAAGEPRFEDGNTLCILPVKLDPGTAYAVSINSDKIKGFRSSEDPNVTVTPYLLKFTTSGTPSKKTAGMTPERWREDLAFLAAELPKRHKNLFFKLTKAEWETKVKALDEAIPNLTDGAMLAGLLELVASVGDQHTVVQVHGNKALTVLPIVFHWFSDGIYVVGASEEYKDAVGCRVEKIGGTDILDACDRLSKLYAWENDSSKRNGAPGFLMIPQFLQATKITPSADEVALSVRDSIGALKTIRVRPAKTNSGLKLIQAFDASKTPIPISRKYADMPYWTEYVESRNMVYFQYNQCVDSPKKPFAEMRSSIDKLLVDHKDARLVIDLRGNGGGNSMILDPFIDALKDNKDLNRKGRLFVIVGRRTFSSAILNAARLRNETEAIFVGETTGASPNHYGEVQTFQLPNSKLTVMYSTKYFKYSDTDGPIVPEIPAETSFGDYAEGIDSALDAITSYKPSEQ